MFLDFLTELTSKACAYIASFSLHACEAGGRKGPQPVRDGTAVARGREGTPMGTSQLSNKDWSLWPSSPSSGGPLSLSLSVWITVTSPEIDCDAGPDLRAAGGTLGSDELLTPARPFESPGNQTPYSQTRQGPAFARSKDLPRKEQACQLLPFPFSFLRG